MRYRKLLLPALLVLVVVADAPEAWAQGTDPNRRIRKTGTTAATFLNIPVGARASAMGGAFSALVDDGTAIYWNPAGLARRSEAVMTAEYASWIGDIDFSFASVAVPTAFGTIGFGITAMQSPEMEVTTEEMQMGTGEMFRASSFAFALSFARQLTDRFSIGGSGKVVTEQIYNSAASGITFDVGTIFVTPFEGVRLGASIANFGTKMQMSGDDLRLRPDIDPNRRGLNKSATATLDTDRFDLPLSMRIGLAGEAFQAADSRLTLAVDFLSPNDNAQYMNLGAELGLLNDLVMIRGGYNELFLRESIRSFTIGGGLRYGFGSLRLTFDYAFEAYDYFPSVNRFTIAVNL
jgi:hypothetical protein